MIAQGREAKRGGVGSRCGVVPACGRQGTAPRRGDGSGTQGERCRDRRRGRVGRTSWLTRWDEERVADCDVEAEGDEGWAPAVVR